MERIPADSQFSCNQINTIVKEDSTYRDMSVCRIENLIQRESIISSKPAKRIGRQNQIRSRILFGNAVSDTKSVLPHFFSNQIIENESLYGTDSYFKEILSYIHNQDGEKV